MASAFTSYAEFEASEAYSNAIPGAGFDVLITDDDDPSTRLVVRVTSFQTSDTFEKVAITEAGTTGINEFADGAHSGSGSIACVARAKTIDLLPTRGSAIGKRYTILCMIASDGQREQQGAPLGYLQGVVISTISDSGGARDTRSLNINFSYTNRLSGKEYAALAGL